MLCRNLQETFKPAKVWFINSNYPLNNLYFCQVKSDCLKKKKEKKKQLLWSVSPQRGGLPSPGPSELFPSRLPRRCLKVTFDVPPNQSCISSERSSWCTCPTPLDSTRLDSARQPQSRMATERSLVFGEEGFCCALCKLEGVSLWPSTISVPCLGEVSLRLSHWWVLSLTSPRSVTLLCQNEYHTSLLFVTVQFHTLNSTAGRAHC